MRFVINKKTYDTETSDLKAERGHITNSDLEELYMTKKGALWIVSYGMNSPWTAKVTTENDSLFYDMLADFTDLPADVTSKFEEA